MLNKVTLIGHLGADPELKYTAGGVAYLKFNLATTEKYKNKNGELVSETEWHRVTMWGQTGETIGQYLHKGSLVYVEGRIKTDTWEDDDGNKQYSVGITANVIRMLDKKE